MIKNYIVIGKIMTIGQIIDLLSKYPKDYVFRISVDISKNDVEPEVGRRAFGNEFIDIFDVRNEVTLCVVGELNDN